MSIGTFLLVVGAAGYAWKNKSQLKLRNKPYVYAFWAYLGWIIFAIFWTSNTSIYLIDIRIKLPYLFIPLAFALLPAFSQKQKLILWVGYCLSQLAIALFTVAGYLQDWENNIEIVKKNSALQIYGGTNHIYFGVTLALAILIGFNLFMNWRTYFPKGSRLWALVYVLTAVFCLHSLTSRTGLVAFYGGFIVYALAFMLKKGQWKLGLLIILLFALVPIVSYQLIPSFKYRVDVTLWDVEYSSNEGADLNYQSVGLRFKTWECCVDVWQENPLLGVGFGDMEAELFACYEAIELKADRSKWLASAHNQYLEQLVGGGIPGLLLLLTLFLIPLWRKKVWLKDNLIIGFLALLAAGMLTESFLERQLGINLFLVMYFLLLKKNDS